MKQIRLIEQNILTEFVDLLLANRQRVYRLWIVSPWLSLGKSQADPLAVLAYTLQEQRFAATIITRPPKEEYHHKCISMLRETKRASIFAIENLHSKLYLMECNGFRAAVIGSVNFTSRGNEHNHEIAIEIKTTEERGRSDESSLLSSLIAYATELKAHPEVKLL
jgi:hypothetical protein